MVWDGEIHSNPPTHNSDGSWRARRGRKDEYEAAIAAHKARTTAQAGQALASAPVADVTVQHSPAFVEAAATLTQAPTGMVQTPVADPTPAVTAPQPTTMPTAAAMPAPQPTHTPKAPVTYEQMGTRFLTKFQQPVGAPGGLPVEYETVYADLGMVNPADPTNQTNIDRCWAYMDALDQGMGHGDAVRHARSVA
jgi:hypothetical protein